jgi:hypothetical protein
MANNIEANTDDKYYCECCNYKCKYPTHWQQHIDSEKHKNNGIRPPRSDKIYKDKCSFCNYSPNNLSSLKTHCLTHHSTKEERKKEFKFYCDKCDFGTFADILFTRHLETKKHSI